MTPTPALNAAAQALGRRGGQARTAAQTEARQKNGALGGRPRRVCDDCGKPVRGGHINPKDDKTCGGQRWHLETPTERRAVEAAKPRRKRARPAA